MQLDNDSIVATREGAVNGHQIRLADGRGHATGTTAMDCGICHSEFDNVLKRAYYFISEYSVCN